MIKNLNAFMARMTKRLEKNALGNAEQLIARSCMLVESRAKESILRDPVSGRQYGKHQASAAGEAPASDTGNLASSITFKVDANKDEGRGEVSASAPYAASLEFGTVHIKPRPYMQPALEENRNKIIDMFKRGGLIK